MPRRPFARLCSLFVHNYCAHMASAPALRVLAHPLRSRLLGHLRVHGPATATELAAALDTHTGATSYHLRKLEDVGLVQDTETGQGKRRVWRAAADPSSHDAAEPDLPMDADDQAAADWLARDYVQHFTERADSWVDERLAWPQTWQQHCGLNDHAVLVTTEQLTALTAELTEVLDRYRRAGAGSPGARRVAAYTALLPVDPPPQR